MAATNAGTASHTSRSEHEDPTAAEVLAARREIKRQDWAFVVQLRAALLCGLETPAGVLGHEHRPRRRSAPRLEVLTTHPLPAGALPLGNKSRCDAERHWRAYHKASAG
jgi:hypothetical protein